MDKSTNQPYKILGDKLKSLRKNNHETIEEVSSAVEIDNQELVKIESGITKPSEEILMYLINHFQLSDNEATTFWQLANYESSHNNFFNKVIDENLVSNLILLTPVELRPLYSDHIDIILGSSGLVINFNQQINNQLIPITKVGMTLEQADILQKTLENALLKIKYNSGPKKLDPPQQ